jgi:5-methylthioribose kinase
MLNQSETFVIDPEFAFVGPFGFDIGALIGNLVMSYVSHQDEKYQKWILELIEEILTQFEEKFLALWSENNALHVEGFIDDRNLSIFKKEFMKNILRESIGFAGCKMARRMFGIAGVEDIRGIEDKQRRDKAEARVLEIAKKFVKNYENIESIKNIREMIV